MLATNRTLSVETAAAAAEDVFTPVGHALLRFNNLPYTELASTSTPALRETLARIHELEGWMRARAPALCELLHGAIASRAGDRAAHPLITLKRDIYAGRASKVALEAITPLCDAPELAGWIRASREVAELRGRVEHTVALTIDEERETLRRILAHPDFRRAAMVSSLNIDTAVNGYLEKPVAEHRKRQRKSEQGLLMYALRAMTRTSPYSFYTSVGFGTFDAPARATVVRPPAERVQQVEAHHAVIRRLVETVITHPEVRRHVPYRACPGTRVVDGHLVYDIYLDDPVAHPRTFKTRQLQGRFPATRPIVAILSWLGNLGPRPYGAIEDALVRAFPGSDAANTRAVLEKLTTAGLLVPHVPIRENTADILADAVAFLGALPAPLGREVAGHLDEMRRALRELPVTDLAARRASIVALRRAWEQASAAAGHDPGHAPLFYEDTAIAEHVNLDPAAWKEALDDVAEAAVLIEVFDNNDILQAVFRDMFVDAHGRGGACTFEAFLPSVPPVFERWFRLATTGLPAEMRERFPHLARKKEIRKRLKAAIRARITNEEEIELPRHVVREVAEELAGTRPSAHTAYGVFLQPEIEDGVVRRVVINHAYNGLGQFFSRFLGLLGPEATERVRRHILSLFPEDRVIAGLRPVFGFNANLHPALAPHECALGPGDAGEGQLGTEELVLEHDVARDAVILRRGAGGPQVTVLYSGFLIPFLLPSRHSLLASLEGPGQSHTSLHDVDRSPRDRISHYPRVRYGRVILARRAWFVPSALFPRPAAGETEAAYYTRLNLWRLEHGLPAQAFMKAAISHEGSFENPADFFNELDHQRDKPQFVDFESALLVRFVMKWLEDEAGGADLVLEEVNPAPAKSLVRDADGAHVTELLVEVDRSPWRHTALQRGDL